MKRPIHKHIQHHAHRAVHHLREQPLEVRRQVLVFASAFLTFLVVLFWVSTLKDRLTTGSAKLSEVKAVNLIQESVTKVYSNDPEQQSPDGINPADMLNQMKN